MQTPQIKRKKNGKDREVENGKHRSLDGFLIFAAVKNIFNTEYDSTKATSRSSDKKSTYFT